MKPSAAFEKIEFLIRSGHLVQARQLFRSLPLTKVRADNRLPLANFARRLDLLSIGLRLLRAQVFERPPTDSSLKQAVLAEYAILLLQNGNIQEAANLLAHVERVIHQDVLMAKAWCHFEMFEYGPSIPLWERYISLQSDPYWRLAGRINLAEALIATGAAADGVTVLDSALVEAEAEGNLRLMANALHLRARAFFELQQIAKSDLEIERALKLLNDRIASDAVLIRRQAAINRAFAERDERHLLLFRAEAKRRGASESVRECDFQRLKLNFQPELFAKLYQGTPLPAYRAYLEKSFRVAPPTRYQWGEPTGPELDLKLKRFRRKSLTRQNASLMNALLKDFYRPPSVGEIFASLFPEESYDPVTSPIRVHQAIRRLREWLIEARVPLKLKHEKRRYRLQRVGYLSLFLSPEDHVRSTADDWLRIAGVNGLIAVRDAQEHFMISRATAKRRLSQAQSQGILEMIGSGRGTKYRVRYHRVP